MKKRLTMEQFITAWQKSDNVEAISKQLGISKPSIYEKAKKCRQHGVPLKKLSRAQSVDWEKLKELAKSLA